MIILFMRGINMLKRRLLVLLCAFFVLTGCSSKPAVKSQVKNYAVLTKKKKSDLLKMKKHYDLIVIRSKGLTKEDMHKLRKKSKQIYFYMSLKKPHHKAESLKADGVFISKINDSKALKSLIQESYRHHLKVIVNNGYDYRKTIYSCHKMVTGVNQTSMMTKKHGKKYIKQDTAVSSRLKGYLETCQKKGIATYLVEYTKNTDWKAAIQAYCKKHNITYYNPTIK